MQRVDCPTCGKSLKYGDAQAGKPAKCPRCLTAFTLPMALDEPPPPPPRPAPVPPPAPRPIPTRAPAAPVVVPWTPAAYPPRPATPSEPLPLDDPPPPGGGYTDDFDTDGYDAPRSSRWHAGFGAGCGLVKWGMWVNFASSAYIFMLVEVSLLGVAMKNRDLFVVGTIGLYVPVFLLQLAGTAMMLAGWWRMTAVPANSGASGLLAGAGILAGLRELVLFVGTAFLLAAAVANGLDTVKYLANAYAALVIGNVCIWVATFSAIPGMAIVGGELPSRRLRQKAGQITLVHQILAIAALGLVALAYFTLSASELVPGGGGGAMDDPAPLPRGGRVGAGRAAPAGESHPELLMMFFVMVLLVIEGVYTYLHYSLYSVGQREASRGGDTR